MNSRLENGGDEGASGLEALQNEVAVEVALLAVGGEAGDLTQGGGEAVDAQLLAEGALGLRMGAEEGIDFLLGRMVAEAVDALWRAANRGESRFSWKVGKPWATRPSAVAAAALAAKRASFRNCQNDTMAKSRLGRRRAEEPLEEPGRAGRTSAGGA